MTSEKKVKVFVLDSNSDYRYACCDNLERLGFEVVGNTGDGKEALAAIKRNAPDNVNNG